MRVAVVGLGKIGLPLAVQAASRRLHVTGVDVRSDVVAAVNASRAPFPGEPGLEDRLEDVVGTGYLTATTDGDEAVRQAEAVIVIVPLFLGVDGAPDFTAIDAATATIGRALQTGALVSFETTLPIGTTRHRLTPALEAASCLTAGHGFFVCHSPERVSSGRVFTDLRRYPKLVGGVDAASEKRAAEFYGRVLEFDPRPDLDAANGVWCMGGAESAEFAKLAETTFRDVNIALANEFAMHAERVGVDVHRVISAANSQPFSHIHQPGVAVGGHCIPVYPRFYLQGDPEAQLPAIGRAVNESMPGKVVDRLCELLGGLAGRRIAILGATYRGGVKELSHSGVFQLIRHLDAAGALTAVHDPMLSDDELRVYGMRPYQLGQAVDGAIVQADHPHYRGLTPEDLPGVTAVLDGRGVIGVEAWPPSTLVRLGAGTASVAQRSGHA